MFQLDGRFSEAGRDGSHLYGVVPYRSLGVAECFVAGDVCLLLCGTCSGTALHPCNLHAQKTLTLALGCHFNLLTLGFALEITEVIAAVAVQLALVDLHDTVDDAV